MDHGIAIQSEGRFGIVLSDEFITGFNGLAFGGGFGDRSVPGKDQYGALNILDQVMKFDLRFFGRARGRHCSRTCDDRWSKGWRGGRELHFDLGRFFSAGRGEKKQKR